MKRYKRVLAILLAAGICLMFTGCSLIRNVADMGKHASNLVKELTTEQEPSYTLNDSLTVLEPDEFDIYENGEVVLTSGQMGITGFGVNNPYSEYYGSKFHGTPYDLRGHDLETKRGIHLGSTMDDILKAYGNTAFAISKSEVGESDTFDVSLEEAAQKVSQGGRVQIFSCRYVTKDGKVMTDAQAVKYADDNNYYWGDVATHIDEYFDEAIALVFTLNDGIVTGIGIDRGM